MKKETEVFQFLGDVRDCIKRNCVDFKNSDKRKLTELGISYREAICIVENLQVENYYRGPKEDHNNKGNLIYEFGYLLEDLELYIKLTFRREDDLFIMSFHEARYKINYPLKKRNRKAVKTRRT